VIGQGGCVALQHLEFLAELARGLGVAVLGGLVEARQAGDRDEAFAGQRQRVALLADALDDFLQVAGLAGDVGGLVAEDLARDLVDIVAGGLEQ
jgi:hypothetical protein